MGDTHLLDGRYDLLAPLGVGGMSTVWHAVDVQESRECAVKVIDLRRLDATTRRALKEGDLLARLAHPSIIKILDRLEEDERQYLVLELANGSLTDWVRQHGPVPPATLLPGLIGVLAGLEHAHKNGVIHRDVKPSNLLLRGNGDLVLSDFGIASSDTVNTRATHTGGLLGSIGFMAPEQRLNPKNVGPATDVYALAVTAIWAMTGEMPADLYVPGERERLAGRLPAPLVDTLCAAGCFDPDERTRRASDLRTQLETLLPDLPPDDTSLAGFELEPDLGGSTVAELRRATYLGSHSSVGRGTASSAASVGLSSAVAALVSGLLIAGFIALQTGGLVDGRGSPSAEAMPAPLAIRPAAGEAGQTGAGGSQIPPCDTMVRRFQYQTVLAPREAMGSRFADLDEDGSLDLVVVHQLDENAWVYWGSAEGRLGEHLELDTGRVGGPPAVGDINGDGHIDLLFPSPDDSQIAVFHGDGERRFWKSAPLFQSGVPKRLFLADWNADGRTDLLIQLRACLAWRAGDGSGNFGPHECLSKPDLIVGTQWKHDEFAGLMVGDAKGQLVLLKTDGSGWISDREILPRVQNPVLLSERPRSTDTLEYLELISQVGEQSVIRHSSGPEGWTSCTAALLPPTTDTTRENPTFADFNGDGFLDIFLTRTCAGCTSNHVLLRGERP